MNIGIVGAGIMGRMLAWQLAQQDHQISLFERDLIQRRDTNGHAAAYTAAGMLTPISEADSAEHDLVYLGQQALSLWPGVIASLNTDVDFRQSGSLILAHTNDRAELLNFHQHLARLPLTQNKLQELDKNQLTQFNQELGSRFSSATFIQDEAWLAPQALLLALAERLKQKGCKFVEQVHITKVQAGKIASETKSWDFDYVIDCRGLGAKPDMPQLRGVRGEVIWLYAPEVDLQHLVRLMHPRYRIYIVPRANNIYVIGATQIESANQQPITVRSALELLSAAYSVHSGFAEANIIETRTNCRPALPNNLPRIEHAPGFMRVNGLFRHGFLLAPTLAQLALQTLYQESINDGACQSLIHSLTTEKSGNTDL